MATRFTVIPANFGPGIYQIEIVLENRGRRAAASLLNLAASVLRSETIRRANADYGLNWGPIIAAGRIRVQPYARDITTGRAWELRRYVRLRELNGAILRDLIDLQSGEQTALEDLNFGIRISPATVAGGRGSFADKAIPGVDKTSFIQKTKCAAWAISLADTNLRVERVVEKLRAVRNPLDAAIYEKACWGDEAVTRDMMVFYFKENYENRRLVIYVYPAKVPSRIEYTKNWVETDLAKQTLYLLLMTEHGGHWAAIRYLGFLTSRNPRSYINETTRGNKIPFCHKCATGYRDCDACICAGAVPNPRASRHPTHTCGICDGTYSGSADKHRCNEVYCRVCNTFWSKAEADTHRHVVQKPMAAKDTATFIDEIEDPDADEEWADTDFVTTSVWAWDIEVLFDETDKEYNLRDFGVNDDGKFIISTRSEKLDQHTPVLVCCEDIFTGEQKTFWGDNCMADFVTFMIDITNQKVKLPDKRMEDGTLKKRTKRREVILYAHNSMGYDGFFLHQEMIRQGKPMKICANGNKLLNISGGNITALDSMNHIRSGLAKAMQDFGVPGMKGYAPYKFWRRENIDYVGPVPAFEYFENPRADQIHLKQWYAKFALHDQIRYYSFSKPILTMAFKKVGDLVLRNGDIIDDPASEFEGIRLKKPRAISMFYGHFDIVFRIAKFIARPLWCKCDFCHNPFQTIGSSVVYGPPVNPSHHCAATNWIHAHNYNWDGTRYQMAWQVNPAKIRRPVVARDYEYDNRKEMQIYCRNDVWGLSKLMMAYHSIIKKELGMTPLGITTSAGVAHNIFLKKYLPMAIREELRNKNVDNTLENRSKYGWAVLESEEWAYAHAAMHGGNTNTRLTHAIPQNGTKLGAIDIVSSYPDKQASKDFPIGAPTIHVYDPVSFPCSEHYLQNASCECSLEKRRSKLNKRLNVVECQLDMGILETHEGFMEIDITPTNDYHPTIFETVDFKNQATCEPKTRIIESFIKIREAKDRGYKITKVYSAHVYERAGSYWKKMILDLVGIKVGADGSKDPRAVEELWAKSDNYKSVKIAWGPNYEKNPALRQTIKIILNSIWGKCAETIYRDRKATIRVNEIGKLEKHIQDFEDGQYLKFSQVLMSDMIVLTYQKKFEYESNARPDVSKQYLPAAVYVLGYGQTHLQEMLDHYGLDIVLYDTDSVYFNSAKPLKETPSKLLGGWDIEDCCSGSNELVEICTAGPKNYGYRYLSKPNWRTSKPIRENIVIKCKGVRMDNVREGEITWEKYKALCLADIYEPKDIMVHQDLNFEMMPDDGIMVTRPIVKIVRAPRTGAGPKGRWRDGPDEEFRLYPRGFKMNKPICPYYSTRLPVLGFSAAGPGCFGIGFTG